jgi:glycosyltransferase involved in cell wall biosynthesis
MADIESSGTTPLLSVVIPVFNEFQTISRILAAVRAVDIDLEIIVVDDFSTDGTRDRLNQLAKSQDRLRVLCHDRNQGKGAALRTGFGAARGRFVIVQDADLEYDPNDFHKLIKPLLDDETDVVYGSRFSDRKGERITLHTFGNQVLTWLSNKCTHLQLTDMETCYKMFRRDIIQAIPIEENRFGFEPEITAKIAKFRVDGRPVRVCEIPVSYDGRTNREGKKIGWKDGFRAIWCVFKYSHQK